MNKYVMAVDIGTTSVKVIVMNQSGDIIVTDSHGYSISSCNPDWVEQNPEDWWQASQKAIKTCVEHISTNDIVAISLSGHMSAPVFMNSGGTPIYPSILISDTRSKAQTDYLNRYYYDDFVERTGNKPIDAFTVSKLLWIKENLPQLFGNSAIFVFPKDYIRYKLTNKFGTEPTDAGNSLLYDPFLKDWNWELIQELGLPTHIFPELYDSLSIFGGVSKQAAKLTGLREGIPVVTGGADMACSQLGTGAIDDETMAITLSTSGQVVIRVPTFHEKGIGKVTFHNSVLKDTFYTMGTLFTGGLGVEWAYKLLHNKDVMSKTDYQNLTLLTSEMKDYNPGSNGLLFLPFLVGSATPYYDPHDRAALIGLGLNQKKSLILHSVLEGISYNILENVNAIKDMGIHVETVHIGAGGSRNKIWCQMIADIIGCDIVPLVNRDASSLGAAIIAGVGVGLFSSIEEAVQSIVKGKELLTYDEDKNKTYQTLFESYQAIYQSVNRYFHQIH